MLSVTHCTFTSNNASSGGAIYGQDGSALNMNHCTFTANNASFGGGAITSVVREVNW